MPKARREEMLEIVCEEEATENGYRNSDSELSTKDGMVCLVEEYVGEDKIIEEKVRHQGILDHSTPPVEKYISSLNDIDIGEQFGKKFADSVSYLCENKSWLAYVNGQWSQDHEAKFHEHYKKLLKVLKIELDQLSGLTEKQRKMATAQLNRLYSNARFNATLKVASRLSCIRVHHEELDSDQYLLNFKNGTLNLKTKRLQNHNRQDKITKMVPFNYSPKADAPTFKEFLKKIFIDDPEKLDFVQRAMGYSITGDTLEQVIFLPYGLGANGKTTLFETCKKSLGEYAMHSPSDTFLYSNTTRIRNDLARLSSARLVTAAETGMGKKLDESIIKQLTGGDEIVARYLWQEFSTYRPTFKIFVISNHLPEITGIDHGILRRLCPIPFDVVIQQDKIDKDLPRKLEAELAGIMNWMIEGCYAWQERGLDPPKCIKEAIKNYQEEMDQIQQFLDDMIIKDLTSKVRVKDLHLKYLDWTDNNCHEPKGKKIFGKLIREKGYQQSKSGSTRYWNEIKFR
jgi:putative DNA primase/helicase